MKDADINIKIFRILIMPECYSVRSRLLILWLSLNDSHQFKVKIIYLIARGLTDTQVKINLKGSYV